MSGTKFKVAICGGGVGGLTFAVALARFKDIELEIYEAATEFSPIGAGIAIWPRVWDALSSIGLESLAAHSSSPPTRGPVCCQVLRKSDHVGGYSFCKIMSDGTLLFFHRADFHGELAKRLPPSCKVQYSKRLESYSRVEKGKIRVHFQDGSTTTCDLLVGADGIKSAVRKTLLNEQARVARAENRTSDAEELLSAVDPVWSGTLVYRSLVPVEKLKNYALHDHGTQYLGKNRATIAYPVANGKLVNVSSYLTNYDKAGTQFKGPWISKVEQNDLLSAFDKWEPQFVELLQGMNQPTVWATHIVKPLPSYVGNGVALLGDAAHAMEPHQGSGAGQAIEDACFLAEILGHPLATLETLPKVLHIYDALRRPFASDIARKSHKAGRLLSMNDEEYCLDGLSPNQERERLAEMGRLLADNWRWTWATSLSDMIHEGVSLLEGTVEARL